MNKPWYSRLYIKSPIVKIGIGLVAVLLSLALVIFQGFVEEPRMEAQTNSWYGRGTEIGGGLFANNCASCHNTDGGGLPNVAPALNSRYFFEQRLNDVDWAGSMEQYVALTLQAGRPSKVDTQWSNVMPTWGNHYSGPLRDDQIDHLVNYVLNWEESARQQTPAEDPWQFYQDALSKELPYLPSEPGYEEKLAEALAAATAAGARNYSVGGASAPPPADAEDGVLAVREPEALFSEMGCLGCHNLDAPQDADNKGAIGPNMGNIVDNAATRVPSLSPDEYVRTSITKPGDYVVEGYSSGIMPQNFVEQMSEEEIEGLVTWLLVHQ